METAEAILNELRSYASESIRRTLLRHGVAEPVWGVKVEHLKKIQKRVKRDYQLALELYESGVYDAMYLAGLIADDQQMTRKDLRKWAKRATSGALWPSTVHWVAAESRFGWELAMEWIDADKEPLNVIGWMTVSSLVAIKDDAELDIETLTTLIQRVESDIHTERNRVRYAMNSFLIAVGCHVKGLTQLAIASGRRIGTVSVDVGQTDCKIPDCLQYIEKARQRGVIGKKRKSAKC